MNFYWRIGYRGLHLMTSLEKYRHQQKRYSMKAFMMVYIITKLWTLTILNQNLSYPHQKRDSKSPPIIGLNVSQVW